MRAQHDTILVGVGTALNDNPQLNSELLLLSSNLQTVTVNVKYVFYLPKTGRQHPFPSYLIANCVFA